MADTEIDPHAEARATMVARHIAPHVRDQAVVGAMLEVPRHRFVPNDLEEEAYRNQPLPIGVGQTISQPLIVALMTELLELTPDSKVLEIGTGSGYQTAILASLAKHVYTVEIIPELSQRAQKVLSELGFSNVTFRIDDGHLGWPEQAPFDAVIVTAAPGNVPRALVQQLGPTGRLVLPLGTASQELVRVRRTPDGIITEEHGGVRFVPLQMGRSKSENPPQS